MDLSYTNRAMTSQPWPPVVIVRGLPGHPEGAIRYPRPELRERWEKLGICKMVQDPADVVTPKPTKRRAKRKARATD